jgi:hypothetical protein
VWRLGRRLSEVQRQIGSLGDARRHARLNESWPDRHEEGFRARLLRKLHGWELDRHEVRKLSRKTRRLERRTSVLSHKSLGAELGWADAEFEACGTGAV